MVTTTGTESSTGSKRASKADSATTAGRASEADVATDTERAPVSSMRESPVFGDIVAKMQLAAELEVQRLLRLGLPVIVSTENGIEDLSARPSSDKALAS